MIVDLEMEQLVFVVAAVVMFVGIVVIAVVVVVVVVVVKLADFLAYFVDLLMMHC